MKKLGYFVAILSPGGTSQAGISTDVDVKFFDGAQCSITRNIRVKLE